MDGNCSELIKSLQAIYCLSRGMEAQFSVLRPSHPPFALHLASCNHELEHCLLHRALYQRCDSSIKASSPGQTALEQGSSQNPLHKRGCAA